MNAGQRCATGAECAREQIGVRFCALTWERDVAQIGVAASRIFCLNSNRNKF
jgi:hypothetical protein